MSKYIEKVENMTLPAIPLRGLVIFPGVPTSFEINSKLSVKALKQSALYGGNVFLSAVKNPEKKEVPPVMFPMGIVAKVKQSLKLPDGNYRVLIEGISRAELVSAQYTQEFLLANVLKKTIHLEDNNSIKAQALMADLISVFKEFIKHIPKVSSEIIASVQAIQDPGLLCDFIASNILFKYQDKQLVLEECDPLKRVEKLILILENEQQVLALKNQLHDKVREKLGQNQKDYFLREQMKIIKDELGLDENEDEDGYFAKISQSAFDDQTKERLIKEASKLSKMAFGSSESSVIRNFLDTILELPVGVYTKDSFSVEKARKILDADHNGLEKIKERILEYIAVKQLSPSLKGQTLCLIGPPGVGKSSIASSIAKALGRKFVRISLGGVRDEADIRGHRKTYIGSMPGRIAEAINRAGSMNPVVLLDEIDKLSKDAHGDPASALLEVLDPEQNKNFRDHFLEIPLDISDCIFIATANNQDTIPDALYDRMEVITLPSYTRNEKAQIFKDHLLIKQLTRHALTKKNLRVTDDAIFELIDYYTKEAGVRNLERETACLIRKIAMKIATGDKKSFKVDAKKVNELLGARKCKPDNLPNENLVGVVNGLAWTELGGEMLQVEAVCVNGTGKIELTGKLGDVMKESAFAAVTFIRKHCLELGIQNTEFYKNCDIHIHVPEGAVPKDGPSAGVTITSALVSELSGIPAKREIAMTGEITLTGRVLAIGGLREKTMAAYKNGIKTVIFPYDNISDLEQVDPVVKKEINFIPVRHVTEVLDIILDKSFINIENQAENKTSDTFMIADFDDKASSICHIHAKNKA